MGNPRKTTAELIEEQPEMEDVLEHLLAVDAEHDNWTFSDVSLDSGTFGEVVDTPLIKSTTDGYSLTDRQAIRAALNGESDDQEQRDNFSSFCTSLPNPVHRQRLIPLIAVLAFVFAIRIGFMFSSTFRGDHIILAGNDPYFYRYWGEQLINSPVNAFSLEGIHRASLPGNVAIHDVLLIIFVWWSAALLGGTDVAVGTILAWYPPLFGTVTAALTYSIGRRLSNDWRVGLAAAALLAVAPAHAFRSALGFGDHHAMDFLFVALTAWGLVVTADMSFRHLRRDTAATLGVIAVATGVTGSVLTWRGGPLFLLAAAGYLFLGSVSAVRSDTSPIESYAVVVIGLFCAGILTLVAHAGFGLSEPFRGFAPLLLLSGAIIILAIAEGIYRLSLPSWTAAGLDLVTVFIGGVAAWRYVPDVSRAGEQFVIYMSQTGQSSIAETSSWFGGPAMFLSVFGLLLVFAIPYAAWVGLRAWRQHRPVELVALSYFLFLFGLTALQLRFAGSLSMFIVVFAGIGTVHLAAAIDGTAQPFRMGEVTSEVSESENEGISILNHKRAGALLGIFLLVGGLGMITTPVKMGHISVSETKYEAAVAMDDYAERHNLEYPESDVLSRWDDVRMYDSIINGQSKSYGYSRETYTEFLTSTDPNSWSNRLQDRPIGFVVITESSYGEQTMYDRLFRNLGSYKTGSAGLSHYRLVYISDDGSVKAFAVVEGARITGTAEPNATIRVSTSVSVSGRSVTYERLVTSDENGNFSVRVPYPGEYQLGTNQIQVSERAVITGRSINAS